MVLVPSALKIHRVRLDGAGVVTPSAKRKQLCLYVPREKTDSREKGEKNFILRPAEVWPYGPWPATA